MDIQAFERRIKTMNRLEMLRKAVKLAHEEIEAAAALNDSEYEMLCRNYNDKQAIMMLSQTILADCVHRELLD